MILHNLEGCHLSVTSKFPDFSLTFYSFPYPLTDKKKSFLFFTLIVLTASLQNWGVLFKERICFAPHGSKFFPLRLAPNEEGDGHRLSHEKVHSFPLLNRINKFSEDCLSYPFIFKFPDFSLTFQVFSKFPWPSAKFPDFSLTWKKFHFPDSFP